MTTIKQITDEEGVTMNFFIEDRKIPENELNEIKNIIKRFHKVIHFRSDDKKANIDNLYFFDTDIILNFGKRSMWLRITELYELIKTDKKFVLEFLEIAYKLRNPINKLFYKIKNPAKLAIFLMSNIYIEIFNVDENTEFVLFNYSDHDKKYYFNLNKNLGLFAKNLNKVEKEIRNYKY